MKLVKGRTPQAVLNALEEGDTEATTEYDLGDLLVAIVSAARAHGLDAERALRTAVRRVIANADR